MAILVGLLGSKILLLLTEDNTQFFPWIFSVRAAYISADFLLSRRRSVFIDFPS
jgi:hypothetical protein